MNLFERLSEKDSAARFLLTAAAMLLCTGMLSAQTTVFQGADLHTVSDGVIVNGVLVVDDGKITAIGGPTSSIPSGATVVNLQGKRIYPGVLQAYSSLGLTDIDSVRGSVDVGEVGDNNADVRARVAVNADNIRLLPAMGGGVLYAHVIPEGGSFTGTTAVMRLEGWNWEDMTVDAPSGLHLYFPEVADTSGDDEASESKAMKALNQAMTDAKDYGEARRAGLRLDVDRKLQRVLDVINGDLRLLLHADSAAEMVAAIEWAEENEIKDWVLIGTTDAAYLADQLAAKEIPVLMETVLGIPRRDFEPYDQNFAAPAKLAAAGVQFALTGQGDSAFSRNLPIIAGMAVAHGLDPEMALRSVTLAPAEILGVADEIGSLSVGKEAGFFVTDGDILEATTKIERVWIRGREVDLERDYQRQLWNKYRQRPAPTGR